MDIDITSMVNDSDEMPLLSGSQAELGPDAGRITWRNSCEYATRNPLVTSAQFDEVRDYFREFGAWDAAEIDAWSPEELQGLVTQEVAARIREMEHFDSYEEYEQASDDGRVSGLVHRGGDGRFYFDMSR